MRFITRGLFAAFGGGAVALSQWYIVIIIGQSSGVEAVGQYSLIVSIITPGFTLFYLGLRPLAISEPDADKQISAYLFARLFCLLLIAIISLALSYIYIDNMILCLAIICSRFSDGLSDIIYGFLQRFEEFKKVVASQIIRGALSVFIVSIIIKYTNDFSVSAMGQFIGWALALLLYDAFNIIKKYKTIYGYHPALSISIVAAILIKSIPLGISAGLISLISYLPRMLLGWSSDDRDVGVFTALVYLVQIGGLAVLGVGQSMTPRLSTYFRSGQVNIYTRMLYQGVFFAILIGVIAIIISAVCGPKLISTIYGKEFYVTDVECILMAFAGTLSYVGYILGYALTSARVYSNQIWIFTIVLTITLGVGLIAVRLMDPLLGAIFCMITAGILTCILSFMCIFRKINKQSYCNE